MSNFPRTAATLSSITIRIASPDEIRLLSKGEVRDWRFFDNKTGEGIEAGLFDEKIFGKRGVSVCRCKRPPIPPTPHLRCPVCDAPFQQTRAERFGRIELAAKVAHPWFYRQHPNHLALALGDPTASERPPEYELRSRLELVLAGCLQVVIAPGPHAHLNVGKIIDAEEAATLRREAGSASGFKCGTGGDAVHKALAQLDLAEELRRSEARLASMVEERKQWWEARCALVKGFIAANIRPEWMMLSVLPVAALSLRDGSGKPVLAEEERSFLTHRELGVEIRECQDRIAILSSRRPNAPPSAPGKRKIQALQRKLVELQNEQRFGRLYGDQSRSDSINLLYREVIRTNEQLRDAKDAKDAKVPPPTSCNSSLQNCSGVSTDCWGLTPKSWKPRANGFFIRI